MPVQICAEIAPSERETMQRGSSEGAAGGAASRSGIGGGCVRSHSLLQSGRSASSDSVKSDASERSAAPAMNPILPPQRGSANGQHSGSGADCLRSYSLLPSAASSSTGIPHDLSLSEERVADTADAGVQPDGGVDGPDAPPPAAATATEGEADTIGVRLCTLLPQGMRHELMGDLGKQLVEHDGARLSLQHLQPGDIEHVEAVLRGLEQLERIEELSGLEQLPVLQELKFVGSSEHFTALAPCFAGLKYLTVVQLSVDLDNHGAAALTQTLTSLTQLHSLAVVNSDLGDDAVAALMESLASAPGLRRLDVSGNSISHAGVTALCAGLARLTQLEVVSMGGIGIRDQGAAALAEALAALTQVQELDINHNAISSSGFAALARSLASLSRLRVLRVHGNIMGAQGAKDLAPSLRVLIELEELDLGGNCIGSQGVRALGPSIQRLTKLSSLALDCNDITAEVAEDLARNLARLTCLQQLDARDNHFGDRGAGALATLFETLTGLEVLDIRNNGVYTKCATRLALRPECQGRLQVLEMHTVKPGTDTYDAPFTCDVSKPKAHVSLHRSSLSGRAASRGADAKV